MRNVEITDDWKLRQVGIDYNNKLSPAFYKTIDENEAMAAGDQWRGVETHGLSTPTFNLFKSALNYFTAAIMGNRISLQYSSEELDTTGTGLDPNAERLAEVLTAYYEQLWEDSKMEQKVRVTLRDAFLTGDGCIYVNWDESIRTGIKKGIDEDGKPIELMGGICNEVIDNVNVYFGNPNDYRINDNGRPVQPYILLEFREMTSKVKAEAKKHKVPKDEIERITGDNDNEYQSGDRGKIELDESNSNSETSKTTVILKLWEKDGFIYARKSTKHARVRPEWNTKRRLYPVAWYNWETRKNSYHGQAPGTGLAPNQRYINKQFAVAMYALMMTANPKVLYDKTRIDGWTNDVAAIGVEGDITNAATVLTNAALPPSVPNFIDKTIRYTKDFLGANDALLGQINPEQASGTAIVATQQQASIPLENIRQNLYQFIEDLGYIWLDTMIAYYGERTVSVEILGERIIETIDFTRLGDLRLKLKVDVGPSNYWSEIQAVKTLDNLYQMGKLTDIEYFERLPPGYLIKKQELIEARKQLAEQQAMMEQGQEQQFEQMAQVLESLPPDVQQQIMSLPQGEQEQALMQIMQQAPNMAM